MPPSTLLTTRCVATISGRTHAAMVIPYCASRLGYDESSGEAFEHGKVRVWDPPKRLVFEMSGRDFQPDETTEVEVRFDRVGAATRVTVEHRGWERFPADHPVRHGLTGGAFKDMMSVWWADLLASVQACAHR